MNTRGKKIFIVVAALMIVPFLLSTGQTASQPVVIKVAETQPLTSAMTQHVTKYGEILKQKTNGRITVEIYPGAMLGSSPTVAQQLQLGAIDQFRIDPGPEIAQSSGEPGCCPEVLQQRLHDIGG
jgi:TRAP-type C4-dicarboxylate transport system substrate-binding protein